LAEEEKTFTNWGEIRDRPLGAIGDLYRDDLARSFNMILYRLLEDYDVRGKDPEYGAQQRKLARQELVRIVQSE
jgi:hypothetical protein